MGKYYTHLHEPEANNSAVLGLEYRPRRQDINYQKGEATNFRSAGANE